MSRASLKAGIVFLGMALAIAFLGRALLLGKPLEAAVPTSPAMASAMSSANPAHYDRILPQYREFMIKAEAADKIVDPLARCLAFPDLPGNRWPPGEVKAFCEAQQQVPYITLARAKDLVDRGELRELDALFAADLERHFSKTNFSEVIHTDVSDFDGKQESDRFTQLWLEKAPRSPYALLARATHYRHMAWLARGTAWASDTPPENMARMEKLAAVSVDLYKRSIAIEPRLLPAYVGLIDIGSLTSQPQLFADAVRAGKNLDPGCQSIAQFQMEALTPRWGGSYEQMQALASEIAPMVSRRPLLAQFMFSAAIDSGNARVHANDYPGAIGVLKPVVFQTPNPKPLEDLAGAILGLPKGEPCEALVYLIEASRFSVGRTNANWNRGVLLLSAQRPEWAQKFLKLAVLGDPNDAEFHLYLGKSHAALKQFADANTQFRLALRDEHQRAMANTWLLFSTVFQMLSS